MTIGFTMMQSFKLDLPKWLWSIESSQIQVPPHHSIEKRGCGLIWGETFPCKKHLHETWKCKQHHKCRLVLDNKYLMWSCLISWNKVDWQEGHCMNTLMLSNLSGPTNNHPGLRKYFPLQMKLSSWTSVGCYLKLERGTSSHPWRSIWTNFHTLVIRYWSWLDSQIWIKKIKTSLIFTFSDMIKVWIWHSLLPPSDAVSALTRFIGRIQQQGGWQGGVQRGFDLQIMCVVFFLFQYFCNILVL